jgi:hypothetical protein
MRIRQDKRGISNVIVFVLGLVIIVVIVSNVFLWNYEMNQLDWERMQEDISIVDVTRLGGPWSYNPSGYVLGGLTSSVSGSISDLTSDDGVYMTFRSYYSGADTTDFVDQTCDSYPPSAKGTHSDFSAQQAGPDSIYDTLTEQNTASNTTLIDAESFEGSWPPTGWTESGRWNRENNQAYDGTYSADFDNFGGPPPPPASGDLTTPDLDCADADAIYVDFWYRDDDCDSDDFLLRYYNGSDWNLISDLGSTFQEDQWLHYQQKITDSQYLKSTFKVRWSAVSVESGESAYVDYVTIKKEGVGVHEWGITSSAFTSTSLHATYRYMGGTSPDVDNMKVTKLHIRYSGTGTVAIALYTGGSLTDPTGATKRTEAYNVAVSTGWNEIDVPDYDWESNTVAWIGWCHGGGRVYYSGSSGDAGDFQSARGRWNQGTPSDADETSAMPISPGSGSFSDYWYAVYVEYETYYELDLEVQWTSVDYDETNEKLCIYAGDMGSEDLRVDYWTGSTWSNLLTKLTANNWNNVSVSLTSTTFTIRFKGSNEIGDTAPDIWDIDATLLHVWSDEYIAEVEFVGSSNMEVWSQLNWTINSAWTISSVDVTLQLYNYTLNGYPTSGNGYMSYTSSAIANTDETKKQTITVNPTRFRNATGHWKMRVRGVKATDTQFNFKADWIELQVQGGGGTRFTFENEGSITSHLVSLWITNSTQHKHYDINLIINSGQTLTYTRDDVSLPSGEYIVKVVTERGNMATYPGS